MNQLTVNDALNLVVDCANRCRENGDSDMRTIINVVRAIRAEIAGGKTRTEILAHFEDDDDE